MKIWTVATDDDMGTNASVFLSESEAQDHVLSWVGSSREEWEASEHVGKLTPH